MLFSITVSAADYEYTISPSENFVSVRPGDDMSDIAQKLNMTDDQLNTYFNDNFLIYLAVSDDAKSQIKISAFSDNFSSEVGDISHLDKKGLSEFINAISQDSENPADTIINNDRKFVRIKHIRKDIGGIYTVTQYVTIYNNKTFYFVGYNEGENTSNEIEQAFKSFNFINEPEQSDNYTWQTIIINTGIVVFCVLAVIMIIGIIKTYLKNKKDPQHES